MFTGIIEEIGVINQVRMGTNSAILKISAHNIMNDVNIGDSIAVNGVCLTVTSYNSLGFEADVMHETLNRSSLANLKKGSRVNLERAMAANGRFGGHIVSGHVDGTGTICEIKEDDNAIWYRISAGKTVLRYIVEKGSIAIDGISLTVALVTDTDFSVSIIPHTAKVTILGSKKVGDIVNLENDIIGKYVANLMKCEKDNKEKDISNNSLKKESGITMDFLNKYGY